ncbi:hypothetical protein AGLY_010822 [Aphis glycines]|uniref:Uncharacterized protein n=1 Tax=Aphis glycines TaxID=307491 RepID=A0A6G0TEP2_APHGL|nr:hypothetical protein AGLY_010822 [Aphis glycines]
MPKQIDKFSRRPVYPVSRQGPHIQFRAPVLNLKFYFAGLELSVIRVGQYLGYNCILYRDTLFVLKHNKFSIITIIINGDNLKITKNNTKVCLSTCPFHNLIEYPNASSRFEQILFSTNHVTSSEPFPSRTINNKIIRCVISAKHFSLCLNIKLSHVFLVSYGSSSHDGHSIGDPPHQNLFHLNINNKFQSKLIQGIVHLFHQIFSKWLQKMSVDIRFLLIQFSIQAFQINWNIKIYLQQTLQLLA